MVDIPVFKPTNPVGKKYNTPIQEQKEFFPNMIDWAAKNRTQIHPFITTAAGGATLMITIPAGYTAFITFAGVWIDTAGTTENILVRAPNSTNTRALLVRHSGIGSQVSDLVMPFKVLQNETIVVVQGGVGSGGGWLIGWLEPNPSS